MRLLPLLAAGLLTGHVGAASHEARGTVFESAVGGTSLVELYSSEGCSSCPPADAWMSSLRGEKGLWKEFVPTCWHVDYWDYLGWSDRLAKKEYTRRQRAYAASWGSERVYTPGLVKNGEEWRGWRFSGIGPPQEDAGRLRVIVSSWNRHRVEFYPKDGRGPWRVHAALVGFGIETRVRSGENEGRTLRHDFVVVDHVEGDLKEEGTARVRRVLLRKDPVLRAERYGLAVWVTRGADPKPYQAAGGYLPSPGRPAGKKAGRGSGS